ncbi:MAG: tetratricopeptide repeat protein [Treponema sp.]|nr:tetratricopeptide repeat protein [Treponema sp.]
MSKKKLLKVFAILAGSLAFSQSFPWYSLGIPISPDGEPSSEASPSTDAKVQEEPLSEKSSDSGIKKKTAAVGSDKYKEDGIALVKGLESYRSKDWVSSAIFLRRAVSENKNAGAEVLFMLIMSEMYSGDYESAVIDCDTFLSSYPNSSLVRNIQYQKGRALHYTGQNDQSVLVLSDFCHQNPNSRMYPSALYWIAECFYEDYNFDTARGLYEQIVSDYPNDKKAVDAKFKLDAIAQREREQKLLMLLKETGEEYVSSRETYERQLKEYESQDVVSLRRQLNEANSRIAELEKTASAPMPAKAEANVKEMPVAENTVFVQESAHGKKKKGVSSEELLNLKIRAAQLQRLLDEKYCDSSDGDGEFYE